MYFAYLYNNNTNRYPHKKLKASHLEVGYVRVQLNNKNMGNL